MSKACPTAPERHSLGTVARWAPLRGRSPVKLIAEYLERAHQFERMAAAEKDSRLKADFEKQALAYHKLAEKRARETGLPMPKNEEN
jgi:hypothetical protein